MESLVKLQDVSNRIEHLENAAEWIARETVHTDSGISQSATLISVLADQVREMIYELVIDLERGNELDKLN